MKRHVNYEVGNTIIITNANIPSHTFSIIYKHFYRNSISWKLFTFKRTFKIIVLPYYTIDVYSTTGGHKMA